MKAEQKQFFIRFTLASQDGRHKMRVAIPAVSSYKPVKELRDTCSVSKILATLIWGFNSDKLYRPRDINPRVLYTLYGLNLVTVSPMDRLIPTDAALHLCAAVTQYLEDLAIRANSHPLMDAAHRLRVVCGQT